MRDPRYDVLFEPVQLGPVTARNRFFQVPHCNGMGHRDPTAHAVMRGVKAEGGWAVVCTEEVDFHPDSDTGGFIEGRLWDDADIPMHERLVEQVHAHGSLAGIELVHNGMASANLYGRIPPPGRRTCRSRRTTPIQARAMTLDDIADLRRRHRAAVRRVAAARATTSSTSTPRTVSRRCSTSSRRGSNDRDDEYGGIAREPRAPAARGARGHARGVRGRAAVACRIVVDELLGDDGDRQRRRSRSCSG